VRGEDAAGDRRERAAAEPRLHPPLGAGERWFCVQTQPRKEAMALVNLERQGFRSFLPRLMKTVRHARRRRTVQAPLFPGYLFTALDLDRDRWRPINGSFGVVALVMAGDRPRPVPPGVVESLQALADATGLVDLGPHLTPGGAVRVLTGPFADQLGRLVTLDDRGRATVLLEIMGAARTVSLPSQSLVAAG
jgi:transcriptional antiterminator RfaH